MAIPSILPPQLQLNIAQNKSLQLSVGQLLSGSLVKGTGNQLLLQVGAQQLTTNLSFDSLKQLPLDKSIQLQVTQLKPNVVLKVLPETAQLSNDVKNQTIQHTLRQILPNQINLTHGLVQLTQLLQTGSLPAVLQNHLSSLFEHLFKPGTRLTGKELKTAFLNSGIFLESSLARQNQPNRHDFKASLLKLLNTAQTQNLQQPSPALQKLIDTLTQMINRVTHQQIQAIEHPHHTLVELPLSPAESLLELSVEIRKNATTTEELWEFLISLDMPQGTLITKAIYRQETFSFLFWSEQKELERLVEDNLDRFREQLLQSGLTIDKLLISKNKLAPNKNTTQVALIDIHI